MNISVKASLDGHVNEKLCQWIWMQEFLFRKKNGTRKVEKLEKDL